MRKRKDYQNTFSAGVLAPDYDQIGEDLAKQSLRTGLNVALKISGGSLRRAGSAELASVVGEARTIVFDFDDGTFEHLVFSNALVSIRDDTGVELSTLVGPWTTADLDSMQIVTGHNRVDIASRSFWPQVLMRASDGTWSIGDLEFASGIASGIRQPYFRYAALGVTMTPSALSGTIDVAFSEDVLTADYVGIRMRYLTSEIEIATVVDAQNGTATVIQPLFPTYDVTVASTSGFQVGEIVEGDTSGIQGIVAGIVSSTVMTVVMYKGYTTFTASEPLIGPRAATTVTSTAGASGGPAATTVWDEAMIGPHVGYPSVNARHRNRYWLAGFPKAGSYLAASAIGVDEDFDVGTGADNEAFVEGLGDDKSANIRHLIPAAQMLVLTDRSAYYVPESENTPITPTSIDYLFISKDGASVAAPALTAEGAVYIATTGRLLAVSPTGNVRASWRIVDLSETSYHLLNNPVELAVANGIGARPERYVFVRNSDGTIAVLMYKRGADTVGLCPWQRGGSDIWRSFSVWGTRAFCIARARNRWQLEEISFDYTMDGTVDYETANTTYNGLSVHCAIGGHVFASGTVAAGEVPDVAPGSDRALGFDFTLTQEPMPPLSKYIGHEKRRASAWVNFKNRGNVRVNGVLKPAFFGGDDLGVAPALKSGSVKEYLLGWQEGNSVTIEQREGEGAPMECGSVTFDLVS
ncbi:MAG: hypothetical protein GC155_06250 [Alphaproteobacteria bacterium]|nr:hypothetical protein [Alphaproteobacteria bacterium]